MHGCSTGSRQTEADRRYVGTVDWGNSSRVAYVRQPGSVAQQSSDVNAAKHSGRKTDAHTSPWTEHISGCQIRPRRLREVRVAEQEQPRQLVNAVDNQMDEPIRQGATVLLSCLLTHLNTALGRAPKCFNWFWFCCEHTLTAHLNIPWWANLKFYFLISVICLQSISASQISVSAADLYVLFIGLGWLKLAHSFVTAVRLGAESDPRVNINTAFLGQQLHYWARAWWTRPLLLQRERERERGAVHGARKGRWKDERSEDIG